jgi:hypothetical protein
MSVKPSWSEFIYTAKVVLIYAIGTLATIALGVVIGVVMTSASGAPFIPDSSEGVFANSHQPLAGER